MNNQMNTIYYNKTKLMNQLKTEYLNVCNMIMENTKKRDNQIKNDEIALLKAKLAKLTGESENPITPPIITKEEKSRLLKNARQKRYTDKNKEKVASYKKTYNANNKQSIKEHNLEKIKCECGCEVSRISLSRHKKTKKHIDMMNPVKPKPSKSSCLSGMYCN